MLDCQRSTHSNSTESNQMPSDNEEDQQPPVAPCKTPVQKPRRDLANNPPSRQVQTIHSFDVTMLVNSSRTNIIYSTLHFYAGSLIIQMRSVSQILLWTAPPIRSLVNIALEGAPPLKRTLLKVLLLQNGE